MPVNPQPGSSTEARLRHADRSWIALRSMSSRSQKNSANAQHAQQITQSAFLRSRSNHDTENSI